MPNSVLAALPVQSEPSADWVAKRIGIKRADLHRA